MAPHLQRSPVTEGKRTVVYLFLMLWSGIELYPIAWMFYSSVKSHVGILQDLWALPSPTDFFPTNWIVAWEGGYQNIVVGTYLKNSAIVLPFSLALVVFFAMLAGYYCARFPGRFVNLVFYFFVACIVIPVQSIVIPYFAMMRSLGLVNTYVGLILTYATFNIPFAVVLARAYFKAFPREIEEAALLDGCSPLSAFFRIIMPLSKSLMTTVAVVTFPFIWNELLFALVLMPSPAMMTMPVGLMNYIGQYTIRLDYMMAGLSIGALPSIVFYILFQRYVVSGVMAGSVRG